MARTKVYELPEEESEPRTRRYRPRPSGVPLLLVAVFVVFSFAAGAVLGRVSARKPATPAEAKESPKETQKEAPAGKQWTREEFRKEFIGKTPAQILATFGKPESVDDSGIRHTWHYYTKNNFTIIEQVTGKKDRGVYLYFYDRNGATTLEDMMFASAW